MSSIITPKNAIELVLHHKTREADFRPYETKTQRNLFWLAIGSIVMGAIAGGVTYFLKNQYLVILSLVCLLISMVAALGYQITTALPELYKLRNLEKEVSSPLLLNFNNDLDLIQQLASECEMHHLDFARNTYQLMAKQMRERIGILVGAIDKVGIIPLVVTAYFSYQKALNETEITFGNIEWLGVAFLVLYLFAIRAVGTVQWMERISELYFQAMSVKKAR